MYFANSKCSDIPKIEKAVCLISFSCSEIQDPGSGTPLNTSSGGGGIQTIYSSKCEEHHTGKILQQSSVR